MKIFGEEQSGSRLITLSKGQFTIRVPEGTEGAVTRVLEKGDNAGNSVYELRSGSVKGKIRGIKVEEKFGAYYVVTSLEDSDGNMYNLSLNIGSREGKGLIFRLPNINLPEEVNLRAFLDTKGDKARTVFWIVQNGNKVEPAHTKENPNGMPPLEKKLVMGKETYDYTPIDNFAYELAIKYAAMLMFNVNEDEESPI